MGESLAQVFWTSSEIEAHLIKGLLENNGIRCLLRPDARFQARPVFPFTYLGTGRWTIEVLESRAEEAREVIDGQADAQDV